jgi:hypothetical protein
MIVGLQFVKQDRTTKPAVVLTAAGDALNSDAVADTQEGPAVPLLMLTLSGNKGEPNFLARRVIWMTDRFDPAVKLTMTAWFGARAVSVRPVRAKLKSGNGVAALDAPGNVNNATMQASRVFISVLAFLQSRTSPHRLFHRPGGLGSLES